uniref:Uncharacterized protein n=1 Tax=Anguilla anguilla TaxID=7936 RepID=A0A0E9P506_ANGAN
MIRGQLVWVLPPCSLKKLAGLCVACSSLPSTFSLCLGFRFLFLYLPPSQHPPHRTSHFIHARVRY